MKSHVSKNESLFYDLLEEEGKLHQDYRSYLPLLHPSSLRDLVQGWMGDGRRHIQGLQALEDSGTLPDQAASSFPPVPEEIGAHAFLDYFYRAEERLYYHYQDSLGQVKEEGLRSLVLSHLQDQKRHLSTINRLYGDFLYF